MYPRPPDAALAVVFVGDTARGRAVAVLIELSRSFDVNIGGRVLAGALSRVEVISADGFRSVGAGTTVVIGASGSFASLTTSVESSMTSSAASSWSTSNLSFLAFFADANFSATILCET